MRRSQVPSVKKKLASAASSGASLNRSSSSQLPTAFERQSLLGRSSAKETSDPKNYQVFTVVYGVFKPTKKKKEWSNDAILARDNKTIKIYDLEGEYIAGGPYTKDRPLKPDDTLVLGRNEYMIVDGINKEDFISKRCFQPDYVPSMDLQPVPIKNINNKRKLPEYVSPVKKDEGAVVATVQSDDTFTEQPNKLLKSSETSFSRLESKKENVAESYQVFKVVYGTYKPDKKHKEWKHDAILVRKGPNVTMYNMDGDKIETDFYKKNKLMKPDDILLTCGKEVLLVDSIDVSDYENGSCFNENFCAKIDESDRVEKLPPKNSFKKVLTDQTKAALSSNPRTMMRSAGEQTVEEELFPVEMLILPPIPNNGSFCEEPQDVIVDYDLTKMLRDHQREGVEFMYKCIMGFYPNIFGCLVCDEMGLGKTLQCIILIYTLFTVGPFNSPYFKDRVLVLAPSSLIQNWSKEFDKWLKNKRFYPYAVDGKKKTVKHYLKQSKKTYPVLIISYDMFQRNHNLLGDVRFDLIVCDEGHRLKNSNTKIFENIRNMPCKRRILLTGTPVQNKLKEIFSLSDLVNPGILGTEEEFYKRFEEPISSARKRRENDDDDASTTSNLSKIEEETQSQLFKIISQFFIRRLQLSFNYLPKRVDNIVICGLTDIQKRIYEELLNDKNLKKILGEEIGQSVISSYLPYISFLRKLCNHPFLVNADIIKKSYDLKESSLINELSPMVSSIFNVYKKGPMDKSGKFNVLLKLLELIREVNEKVVVVSHFTQTLDLIHQYCKIKNYKTSRLDGSTPIASRQKLVDEFNSDFSLTFVFLLSSKAGGLGLNLIGASHIILYDCDWNPAHDEQSMARIFRDGQKKTANIYRLFTVGTIDEKMFQRQLDKQNLNAVIGSLNNEVQLSRKELKDIFSLNTETNSIIHDALNCECPAKLFGQTQTSTSTVISNSDREETDELLTDQANHPGIVDGEAMNTVKVKEENVKPESDDESEDDESMVDTNDLVKVKPENSQPEDYEDGENSDAASYYTSDGENDLNNDSRLIGDAFSSDDSNISDEMIRPNENESDLKPDYDEVDGNELLDKSSNEQENVTLKQANKPLLEWQHYSYPFDQSDMSSVLFELKDYITFVFRTESQ